MHSSQLIAPAHRSFIRIVAGTSDTHRFFYRVTNTRSRNRHIFRKLIRDNSPREHLSLSLFTGKWRRQTILSIYRNTKKHTRDLTPRSTSAFLSARFPLFCAWPLLPRKKKEKKKKNDQQSEPTRNWILPSEKKCHFGTRGNVLPFRPHQSSIIPDWRPIPFLNIAALFATSRPSRVFIYQRDRFSLILSDPRIPEEEVSSKKRKRSKVKLRFEYSWGVNERWSIINLYLGRRSILAGW